LGNGELNLIRAFHTAIALVSAIVMPFPATAEKGKIWYEFEAASNACRNRDYRAEELCSFKVLVEFASQQEIRTELGPMLMYSAMVGGIRAAINSSSKEAVGFLDSAIVIIDDFFAGRPVYADQPEIKFASSPLHLYRAEACLEVEDLVCFFESSNLLLEREVAKRESSIRNSNLSEPYLWSEVISFRSYIGRKEFLQWPSDLSEIAEHDPKGVDFDERINQVLIEAERRL
jgi:hypothetical protein